jgi:integrase
MEDKKKFKPDSNRKLMDQVREVLRYYHYAYRTEQTYCDWIKRFLKFYKFSRHPKEMGAAEVEGFLSHLATEGKVAAATQRQALNAIIFLYREVLDIELGGIAPLRSKKQRKPPTVLTKNEVQQILRCMEGTHQLMGKLLYGCGLRLMECWGDFRVSWRGGARAFLTECLQTSTAREDGATGSFLENIAAVYNRTDEVLLSGEIAVDRLAFEQA